MSASADVITTSLGAVEVDIRGSGTPVLVIHGTPGGIDAARMMSRFLPSDRFRVIALSRPGYLNTPLSASDTSIDHEADLLAAVLDTLNVDRAGVLAWSGGGGSAYRLAVRHPQRVSSLIQIAALSSRWIAPRPSWSDSLLFGTAFGNRAIRVAVRLAPGQVIDGALAGEGSLTGDERKELTQSILTDPEQREAVLAAARASGWAGPRRAGWNNDVANFGAIESLELDRVQCPVLLVHGDADSDALPEYSYSAHKSLPDSTLVVMERGTHLCFYAHPDAARVQEQARRWLLDHA